MARQVGPLYHEGTIGDIVYYQVDGLYYARFKGTYLSRKQMRRNPKFKRTLQLSDQFGRASKLAGWVYVRYLPLAFRKQGVFGQFTGRAMRLLAQGKSDKEVTNALINYCDHFTVEADTH